MNQTEHNNKIPSEGVRCQLEQRGMRKWDACRPSECRTCGWNLDNQKKKEEGKNS